MSTGNKLNKDQIQKLCLSSVGLVVLVYVYFSFFLGPLNKSRASANKSIADLQGKLANSKTEMAKAVTLENQAGAATQRFATLKSFSPEGAPIAWFPPRIKTFFGTHSVDKATARLESSRPFEEKEMADWMTYSWVIEIPQAGYNSVGRAIAELENSEPLLTVTKVNIRAAAETPDVQQVTLAAATTMVK